MIYIGVDPGVSGGIALISDAGAYLDSFPMPDAEADLLELLAGVRRRAEATGDHLNFAVLERVWAGRFMGRATAFTFGRAFGTIKTALLATRIKFDEVTPQRWQGELGLLAPKGSRVEHGAKDKNIAKRRAQALFPGSPVTHATADAMLLAEYARRLYLGRVRSPSASRSQHGKAQSTETGKGASRSKARREGEEGRQGKGSSSSSQPGTPRHGAGSRP